MPASVCQPAGVHRLGVARKLRDWADGFRDDRTWAVESAQGLGYLLAQQLIAVGETVVDVPAVRASRVRTLSTGRSQKNDPNDARSVAIAALRANDLAAVLPDDHTRILRLLAQRRVATRTHRPGKVTGSADGPGS